MEKPEIRPPAIRKHSNRWLPKLAGVTMSRISTHVQNCITIQLGNLGPCICEVAYQMFTRLVFLIFLFSGFSNSLPLDRCASFAAILKMVLRHNSAADGPIWTKIGSIWILSSKYWYCPTLVDDSAVVGTSASLASTTENHVVNGICTNYLL